MDRWIVLGESNIGLFDLFVKTSVLNIYIFIYLFIYFVIISINLFQKFTISDVLILKIQNYLIRAFFIMHLEIFEMCFNIEPNITATENDKYEYLKSANKTASLFK
jgi:uncharacterized Tic20 family protein